MPDFFGKNMIFDQENNELGTCYSKIVQRWNCGELSDEIGVVEDIKIFGDLPVFTDNGYGKLCPVDLHASISVRSHLLSGQLPVLKMSGFKDEMNGVVITNAFSIGLLDPYEISEKWQEIESEDELSGKPVIHLQGVVCWDENANFEIKLW